MWNLNCIVLCCMVFCVAVELRTNRAITINVLSVFVRPSAGESRRRPVNSTRIQQAVPAHATILNCSIQLTSVGAQKLHFGWSTFTDTRLSWIEEIIFKITNQDFANLFMVIDIIHPSPVTSSCGDLYCPITISGVDSAQLLRRTTGQCDQSPGSQGME